MTKAKPKPPGRPSVYSTEIADHICERLTEGDSLRQICRADNMPNRSTVIRWLAENAEFATRHAYAREGQGDLMDDYVLETANASTAETAAADRVKISAYQWRAAKLRPKKYGDLQRLEHSGPDGGPIQSETKIDVAKALERMSDDELAALRAIAAKMAAPDAE